MRGTKSSSNRVWAPRATRLLGQRRNVAVIKTEEKVSDVNLASLLLADGFGGKYEVAVVLSNDSDLVRPIEIVTGELGLPVGLLNPDKQFSVELARVGTFKKKIREGVLRDSQFPDIGVDSEGKEIHRPAVW